MKTAVIYKDVYFTHEDRYEIDEEGIITSSNNKLTVQTTTLSNGLDYVILRNSKGKLGLYPLGYLIAFVLKKKEVLMYTWYDTYNIPHFDIKYVDGNIHNNHPSNICVIPPNEEWVYITYPENVLKNTYMISSHGRVRNMESNKFLKTGTENSVYPVTSLKCIEDDGTIMVKTFKLHRLIAAHFVDNPDSEKLLYVDHIDGNKFNSHPANLHWVTADVNSKLASSSGLANMSAISTFEVDLVISLLIELNGSIKMTYNAIDHDLYPNLTEAVINNIKHKDHAYIRYDSKYDLKNIEFEKRARKADLTDAEIEEICKALVKCNMDINDTLTYLNCDLGMEHIARHDVIHIRNKSKRSDISDKYFSKDAYEKPREPLTDKEMVEICKALVRNNGKMAKTVKELNASGFERITQWDVQDIKYKKKRTDISNMFFTFDDKVFKPI